MTFDVIIIGYGPTGAALAGLLALRGLSVAVLERSSDVFPQPRAAHVDHTGLRTVQEVGCLDKVLPAMVRNQSLDLVDAAHDLLLRVPAGQESVSGLPTSVYFYQPDFDRALRETVSSMAGVTTMLGVEMLGFSQSSSKVVVDAHDVSSGAKRTVEGDWLIGCDGAWSPVREAMGSPLESLNFDERWLVLDLKLNDGHESLPMDRVLQVCDPKRPHLTTPISADRQRFEFMLLPDDDPEEIQQPEQVAELLKPWLSGEAYVVDRKAIYTFHGLIADGWRDGRVLIAGDAAHQMPPFLGQGMCSGLRDASNLAWKLAGVVKGTMPETILDTYEAERSPHVRTVIEAAIRFGRLVCITDPVEAEIRDNRLRDTAALPDARAFTLPRLHSGPLVLEGGGGLFIQPTIGEHRLDDVVGSRFLVITPSQYHASATARWWVDQMDAHVTSAEALGDKSIDRWMERYGASTVVVRPDRYVLAAGTGLGEITDLVRAAMSNTVRQGDLAATGTD